MKKITKWKIFSGDWWLGRNQEAENIRKTTRDLVELIKRDYGYKEQNEIVRSIKETIIQDRNKQIEEYNQAIKEIGESLIDLTN